MLSEDCDSSKSLSSSIDTGLAEYNNKVTTINSSKSKPRQNQLVENDIDNLNDVLNDVDISQEKSMTKS